MSLPSKELPEQAFDALVTRERTRVVAPLTEWQQLSMALRQEGLLSDAASRRPEAAREYAPPPERSSWLRTTGRWSMRLATGVVLVGAGVLAGRGMTIGQGLVNELHTAMADSTEGTTLRISNKPFASSSEARKSMLRAQTDYERAAAFLSATDSAPRLVGDPATYRDRLTGLDNLTNASLAALKDSPQDPLLNQFYLSAAAAREGTLQNLAHALPANERMVRF